ncbi:hypothetical protein P0D69_28050 [Paraburkholderia sediminicola]|uniref:hypothetical protein n=1 Tax=Paraburkholderia sediminicola TaxID=458836 RepID=UPI0038B92285
MAEKHLFVMEHGEASSMRELMQIGKKLKEVELEVDAWTEEHGIGVTKFSDVSILITQAPTVCWSPPSYMFDDEYDALQFKMIFGEYFDHSISLQE